MVHHPNFPHLSLTFNLSRYSCYIVPEVARHVAYFIQFCNIVTEKMASYVITHSPDGNQLWNNENASLSSGHIYEYTPAHFTPYHEDHRRHPWRRTRNTAPFPLPLERVAEPPTHRHHASSSTWTSWAGSVFYPSKVQKVKKTCRVWCLHSFWVNTKRIGVDSQRLISKWPTQASMKGWSTELPSN